MIDEQQLRSHLERLLDWEDAHVDFNRAVEKVPPEARGRVPAGFAHSLWQLLEHLRLTQRDILDFCRDPGYVEPTSMEDYWPATVAPPDEAAWERSVAECRQDREAMKSLALDSSVGLLGAIPHGSGQTYLRELLLVADHNAYHVGQIVAVRRALGVWT